MQLTSDDGDIFTKPSLKLFCKQLKECHTLKPGNQMAESWFIVLRNSITSKERQVQVHSVWLQGTIHKIINQSNVILRDSSGGIVRITECEKIPGGCSWMQEGNTDSQT